MARPPRLWLLWLWALLAACASPSGAMREEGEEAVSSWQEACQRKEAEALAKRPREKHHIFPQEKVLKEWFRSKGINVHEWTLVLFKEDHDRIHRGAKGGPWNEAWRQYRRDHMRASKEEIWLYAGELIHRFGLYGPTASYWRELPALRSLQQP